MARDKWLVTLSRLSLLLAESERLEDTLPSALQMVAELMGIDVVLLYWLDAEKGELELAAYRGVAPEFARMVDRVRVGEGFNGRAAETGEPVMVWNAAQDPRLSRVAVRLEGIQSQLVVPMKSRGQVVGTICVASKRKREFRPNEVELVTAIADQIGIAGEKSRLDQIRLSLTELLRKSEANYRELFANASDAILIHDVEGRVIEANKACETLLGYPRDQLMGRKVTEFLKGDAVEVAREVRRRLLAGEPMEQRYEQRLARRDGTPAVIEMATRLILGDGEPVGFHNIGRDVTDERVMRDSLRFYLKAVLKAQEEERKRISRELHDDSAQLLLVLIRQLDAIASDTRAKIPGPVRNELAHLHDLALEIHNGLRRYAQELRPAILDDLGLAAALQWIADELSGHGIKVHTELNIQGAVLPHETELVVFRIAQEALGNTARHAGASEASIELKADGGRIEVLITDNGKGFVVPSNIGDLGKSGKLGIIGMQERARLLGGNLAVESRPGGGTTVRVEIPLGT